MLIFWVQPLAVIRLVSPQISFTEHCYDMNKEVAWMIEFKEQFTTHQRGQYCLLSTGQALSLFDLNQLKNA